MAREGDPCPKCEGTLQLTRGIEVGHVFKLGTKYSQAMRATFLDAQGKERPVIMGCYGIGTGRTVAASIEQNHDDLGIVWPMPLAPFEAAVLPLQARDESVMKAAEDLYAALTARGMDVLLDDRDERAGIKFKDADLIGIPLRVAVSKKTLAENQVELKERRGVEAKLFDLDTAPDTILEIRNRYLADGV